MNISMVGIDYSKASIEYREKFSFTMTAASKMANRLLETHQIEGCVALFTCNRTELWFSGLKGKRPLTILLEEKEINKERKELDDAKRELDTSFVSHFDERYGEEAVSYLMELGCGMHSQIFGEDQILTQIKNALDAAREEKYVDSALEMLFRSAVTAAKRVKTEVKLTREKGSIPVQVIRMVRETLGDIKDKTCLIIGNGEMGRMTAALLVEEGCHVFMTLRQYKRKDVIIPAGCQVIPYDNRVSFLPDADIIVSATTSPHFTLKKHCLEGILKDKRYTFIDLAVPRDIDSEITVLSKKIELYDMDKLGIDEIYDKEAVKEALAILKEYKEEFISWYYFREWIPAVQIISALTGELTNQKLTKVYKGLDIPKEKKGELQENVEAATEKAVAKLVYGLREHLDREKWNECISALEAAAKQFDAY